MIKNGNLAAAIIKPDYVLTPEGPEKGLGRPDRRRTDCLCGSMGYPGQRKQ